MIAAPEQESAALDSAGIRFPPPLIYAAAFALALAAGRIRRLPLELSSRPRVVASIVLLALGFSLVSWAFAVFQIARTSPFPHRPASALVTSGPFGWTRNPMYAGLAFMHLGAAVAINSLWAVLTLPVALFLIGRFVVAREERYLERRFGDAYRSYRGRVSRWL